MPTVEVRSETLVQMREVCQFFTLVVVLYILATDVRPGRTTLQACWRSPTGDSICLFVAFFLCGQVESWCIMQFSFFSGNLTYICWVSRTMPKNVRQLDGPSNFLRPEEFRTAWTHPS